MLQFAASWTNGPQMGLNNRSKFLSSQTDLNGFPKQKHTQTVNIKDWATEAYL
jgi:hypothetical protein